MILNVYYAMAIDSYAWVHAQSDGR